jgi:hypothetical protein
MSVPNTGPTLTELPRFRAQNRFFAVATLIVLGGILLVIALLLYGMTLQSDAARSEIGRRLLLTWSPTVFYLWALWTLRGMFAALAKGGPARQGETVARALNRVGWALALGATATVLVSPVVLAMTQRPHAMSAFAAVDVPAATLGVVGLALIAVARMLKRAASLEAEAADLKTVLKDFI